MNAPDADVLLDIETRALQASSADVVDAVIYAMRAAKYDVPLLIKLLRDTGYTGNALARDVIALLGSRLSREANPPGSEVRVLSCGVTFGASQDVVYVDCRIEVKR